MTKTLNLKTLIVGGMILAVMLAFAPVYPAQAATFDVVSDTSVEWSADNSTWNPTFATYVHPSWPSIAGATWIWRTAQTDPADEYANVPEGGWYFRKTFDIPTCSDEDINSVEISITSDNSESVQLNSGTVYIDGSLDKDGPDGQEWNTVKVYDVTSDAVSGENTVLVRAVNFFDNGSYTSNPAGLIFTVAVDYDENSDCDGDDVPNEKDICAGTSFDVDVPSGGLGVNRHVFLDDEDGFAPLFTTLIPGSKGAKTKAASEFSLDETQGCSCTQILERLEEATGFDFEGHRKFGCSKSVIEDWIGGWYQVDSVAVNTSTAVPTASNIITDSDEEYKVVGSGTYVYWPTCPYAPADAGYDDYLAAGSNCVADATFSLRPASSFGPGWVDGADLPNPWENYLELWIDGGPVDWGNVFNPGHVYETEVSGTGAPFEFSIADSGYGDNSVGNLVADIFVKLW